MQDLHQLDVFVETLSEAQLACDVAAVGLVEGFHVARQARIERFDGGEDRGQRIREPSQVPVGDLGLLAETVAALPRVGRVGGPVGVEGVDPAVRPVIEGKAENGHVVGVHHPVDEADPHPVGDHPCGALAHLSEEGRPPLVVARRFAGQRREVAPDREIDQSREDFRLAARRGQLEAAEADERGRHAADDRAGFGPGVPVVKHVPHDRLAGRHEAERAGGRHAQVMHRLAAQELANRRAQHGPAVAAARVRRRARALELQFQALSLRVEGFAERDRPPVSELPGPVAELVPAVVRRVGLHAGEQRIAAEDPRERGRGDRLGCKAEHGSDVMGGCDQARIAHGRGRDARVERPQDLASARAFLRITGQVADKGVVEA
ncbi:hypothetical protein D3C86_1208030 [compost metagenome]